MAGKDTVGNLVPLCGFHHRIKTETGWLSDLLPDGTSDRRGYWADAYNDRPHGSRLWLLHRETEQDEVLRRAQVYAEEALAWLVEDEVAEAVEVEAWHMRRDTLGLRVVIRRGERAVLERQYDYVWRNAA